MTTPLVFLDFDGVICTHSSYLCYSAGYRRDAFSAKNPGHVWHDDSADMIDLSLLANVGTLCAESGAEVVFSTSWRNLYDFESLCAILQRRGFKAPIVGRTPNIGESRGTEILEWLIAERGWPRQGRGPWPEQPIVILEDAEDIRPLRRFQVLTTFEGTRAGFTTRHVKAALRILRGGAR